MNFIENWFHNSSENRGLRQPRRERNSDSVAESASSTGIANVENSSENRGLRRPRRERNSDSVSESASSAGIARLLKIGGLR